MKPIDTLFLDLDDTLYPRGNGVWHAVSERITRYMVERVGLSPSEAEDARRRYSRSFGTSLAGLVAEHAIQPEDYLRFVHDVPLEHYLEEDPALLLLLQRLPQRKFIFSNASEAHAQRVLKLLGVAAAFDGIIGIESLRFVNKPDLRAYSRALELAGNPEPAGCLFVDDRIENLRTAQQLGMRTVLVDPSPRDIHGSDYRIHTLLDLPAAVPELRASETSDG